MDKVKFEHDDLTATKKVPVQCKVTVTPQTADKFTLTLELGEDCFFVTPNGTSQKSVRTFKSNGFMKPRLCEMELTVSYNKPGSFIDTLLSASTKNSNKPDIALRINESEAIT